MHDRENIPKEDGVPCDDGDAQTVNDRCVSGACTGTNLCADVTCEGRACFGPGTCNFTTGECEYTPLAVGAPCDDMVPHTINDTCNADAQCAGLDLCAGVDCPPLSPCHLPGVCQFETGECTTPLAANGTACIVQEIEGTCLSGLCYGLLEAPSECFEDALCVDGECAAFPVNAGIACDDGSDRTVNDTCAADGACVGIDPCIANNVTCVEPGACQGTGACFLGECIYPDEEDGTLCDDNDPRTDNDACRSGTCVGVDLCEGYTCPEPPACRANGTCANGDCSYAVLPAGTPCDDGNANTVEDRCTLDGACEGVDLCDFLDVVCEAESTCHAVPECIGGECQESVPLPIGTPCDDGET